MQAINQKIHLILVLHKSTQATKNIKKMPIDSHAELPKKDSEPEKDG
jgi:hypothetical protein